MNASVDDVREFVAETREEALSKAESFFRTSVDQLDVWVVPNTVQVSGLGSRLLLIAGPKSAKAAAREDRRPERRDERRPDRPERAERPPRRDAAPERAREERPREDRPREDRPREDRARDERPRERPERSDRSEPRARPERAPVSRAEPEPVDEIEDVEDGELGPVGEFIAGILERMKLREVAITESETEDGDIIISLAGKSLTALADRDPRLGAALSHLAHRAAEMMVDEDAGARVEIRGARRAQNEDRSDRPPRDNRRGGGGRSERSNVRRDSDERDIDEVALERMAREGAEIVRRSGEPELLRPMNSRERWVVHNALKDERGVRSESEGEGPRKRVRISPV